MLQKREIAIFHANR